MNNVELELMKNDLELKVGLLEQKLKNGEITDASAFESVEIFKEYERKGTSETELKLLYDDVLLALA